MKIRELIAKLNAYLEEHGNVEVVISDSGTASFEDISVIDYDRDGDNWNHVMLISNEFEDTVING